MICRIKFTNLRLYHLFSRIQRATLPRIAESDRMNLLPYPIIYLQFPCQDKHICLVLCFSSFFPICFNQKASASTLLTLRFKLIYLIYSDLNSSTVESRDSKSFLRTLYERFSGGRDEFVPDRLIRIFLRPRKLDILLYL